MSLNHSDTKELAPTQHAVPIMEPVIGRERLAMEDELTRARALLRDGMARLHDFFDALRCNVDLQAASLSRLSDETTDVAARKAALDALARDHQRVLSQAENAVLGLQLEDVLGQLLEYSKERAAGLSQIASALAQAVDQQAIAPSEAVQERLRMAVADVEKRSNQCSVGQTSLDDGGVELF